MARDAHPVDPVVRGLRPRRQLGRGVRDAAARARGLGACRLRCSRTTPDTAVVVARWSTRRCCANWSLGWSISACSARSMPSSSATSVRSSRSRSSVRMVRQVRQANPHATVCLDPVLGRHRSRVLSCRPASQSRVRDQLVPTAEVATPNVFELAALTGHTVRAMADPDAVAAAADELRGLAGRASCWSPPCRPVTRSACWPARRTGRFRVVTPRLPRSFDGAGDLTAALFLGNLSAGVVGRAGPNCRQLCTPCWPQRRTRASGNFG